MITGSLNRCLIVFVLFFSSLFSFAQSLNQETVIYGPKVLKPGLFQPQKYTINLPGRVDASTTYKLKIINADGANHDQVVCSQKNLVSKLACLVNNLINQAYVLIYRVRDLTVVVNGVKVGSFGRNLAEATLPLPLRAHNAIEFKVSGTALAYATVTIIEVSTKDTVPPVLSDVSPRDGESFRVLNVNVSGRSNEKLSKVMVQNQLATLSNDGLSFSSRVTFSNYGQSNIILQAYDLAGNLTQQNIPVTLLANMPPVAQIAVSAADFIAAANVSFSGLGSYDLDGSIVDYAWDFGDGSSASGSMVDHVYNNPGTYFVSLTVTDDQGLTNKTTARVVVSPNQMPVASIKVDHASGNLPFTVNFDASESVDSDGKIVSYVWSFADGESARTETPNVSHTYNFNGNFSAVLTVIDNKGGSNSSTIDLFANSVPVPTFTSSGVGFKYKFDASGTTDADGEELIYSWDFGDGSTDSGKIVEHLYSTFGNYSVKLTVTDRISSASFTSQINIADPNQVQDEGEESGSDGYLTLLHDADKKFNALNETIVFQVENAQISSVGSNTLVEVNGEIVPTNLVSVSGQQIAVSNFLKNGLNEIRVSTVDTLGLPIEAEFQVWAGQKNVSVSAVDQNGNVVQGLTLRFQLGLNESVVGESANNLATNLPNENIVIYAQDNTGRGGVGLLKKSDESVTIRIWENEQPIESVSNNFENGIGSWKVSADSYQIIQVPNGTEKRLQASSNSNIRISKTIKPNSNTKNLNLNLNMTSTGPEDIYVIVFRNKSTGEVRMYNDTLKNFGLPNSTTLQTKSTVQRKGLMAQSTESENSLSGKSAKYFTMRNGSEDAEVSVYILKYLENNTTYTISVSELYANPNCFESIAVYDWTPNIDIINSIAREPVKQNKAKTLLPLRYISVGKIPRNYNYGRNNVKVVIESCNSDLSLKVNATSAGLSLGGGVFTKENFFAPSVIVNTMYSATIDLNEIYPANTTGVTNLELLENYLVGLNANFTDLTLSIEEIDLGQVKSPPIYLTNYYPYLVRSDFPDRRFGKRDDGGIRTGPDQGGDDWSMPWARTYLASLLTYDSTIQYNDISNMNGTFSPDHTAHVGGNLVDMIFYGLYFGHRGIANEDSFPKSQPTEDLKIINRLIGLHKQPGILEHISRTIITHNIPLKGIFADFDNPNYLYDKIDWNRIRHTCLPDGRYAKSVITRDYLTTDPVHGDHFHVELKKDAIVPSPKPSGSIDLKIRFKPKPSPDTGLPFAKLEFSDELFKENANGESYEVFVEQNVRAYSVVEGWIDYKEFKPMTPAEVSILTYGRHKMKIVKIKRHSAEPNGASNFTCHQDIPSIAPLTPLREAPEYFWVDILPEGICEGQWMRPVRGNRDFILNGSSLNPESEVGFIGDGAVVSPSASVGMGGYVCSGTILDSFSEVMGGPNGLAEVSNSHLKSGVLTSGYVNIKNSILDHVEVAGAFDLEGEPVAEQHKLVLNNVIATDLLNGVVDSWNYVPTSIIRNSVRMIGTSEMPVRLNRQTASFVLMEDFPSFSNDTSIGPVIGGEEGNVVITGGANITDSLISVNSYQSYPPHEQGVFISGGSVLNRSVVLGDIEINNSSFINRSYISNPDIDRFSSSGRSMISGALVKTSRLQDRIRLDGSIVEVSENNFARSIEIDHSYLTEADITGISKITQSLFRYGSVHQSDISESVLVEHNVADKSYSRIHCYIYYEDVKPPEKRCETIVNSFSPFGDLMDLGNGVPLDPIDPTMPIVPTSVIPAALRK